MSSEAPPPPPPPQPPYPPISPPPGAPVPPYQAAGRAPDNGMGTAGLVMAILQFVILGPLGSVLAIIFGRIGMNRAKRGEATNGGVATAAFWLGIVGLVLSVVVTIFLVVTGALIVKEVKKDMREDTDPVKNSHTGLADGDYQMNPSTESDWDGKCGFAGPAMAVGTEVSTGTPVSIVGQGAQCGSPTVRKTKVLFTVSDGVAKITEVSPAA